MLERLLASFIALVLLCLGFAIGSNRHQEPSGNIILTIHPGSSDADVINESSIKITYTFTASTNNGHQCWSFTACETNHIVQISDESERQRWSNYFQWMTYTNQQSTNQP